MNLNYESMLEYVYQTLKQNEGLKSAKPQLFFRNRYEHIKRVYGWAKRILKEVDCKEEVVLTAVIFHDVGYKKEKHNHALLGSLIFEEYAKKQHFDQEFTALVSNLIRNHSNKALLKDKETPIEMIVLLEADLLDEEGALGIVFDLLAEGYKLPSSYELVFNEISMHSAHILSQDYMVTPVAQKIWEEKKALIKTFIEHLEYDLFLKD